MKGIIPERFAKVIYSVLVSVAAFQATNCPLVVLAAPGMISTVAGGWLGDGELAVNAYIGGANTVAVDAAGNMYIVDRSHHRIRKVDVSGVISTVAGNGLQAYAGDGGQATSASFDTPQGVAVDASGNLFIADSFNHRIRKVDASGVITTVAGNGFVEYSGDGGPATAASLHLPTAISVDASGNLYIADTFHNCVRKVDTSGEITTVAGNGIADFSGDDGPAIAASLNTPYGVAVDASGNLYIADTYNYRIRKVDTSGEITTVAGNGFGGFSGDDVAAIATSLSMPYGVAVDASGNLYIADADNNRVRQVDTLGVITTVAGNGLSGYSGDGVPATSTSLYYPFGVAIDVSGNLFIADTNNLRIRKVDTSGEITTVAGNNVGDGGPAVSSALNNPHAVAAGASGELYIADTFGQRIRKVDAVGVITTVAGTGVGGYSGDGGPATSASFASPEGVAVDASGNIYISANQRIRKVNTAGTITTIAGNGGSGYSGDGGDATSASLNWPTGVAVSVQGTVYIVDTNNHRIRKVDASGKITTVAGNGVASYSGDDGPAASASLKSPRGVAVDALGNLYIADTYNERVRKVDTSGMITTFAGSGARGYAGDGGPATAAKLASPNGLATDRWGNLYIAEYGNQRIRKVDASGVITTVAGNGAASYSGDGGTATSASLAYPYGVALDVSGKLYIADAGNDRVRRVVFPAASVTLTPDKAGPQNAGTTVLFQASATGGSGTYEYQFWRLIGGVMTRVQDYSTNSTYTWDTTSVGAGVHFFQVRARNAGSKALYEAIFSMNYRITWPAVSGLTVTPSPASPRVQGTSISFQASGSGGSGSYEYEFWRKVDGVMTLMQAYSANDTWSWDTAGIPGGTHFIQVRVRNAGSNALYDAMYSLNYVITWPPVSDLTVLQTPLTTQTQGLPATFQAAGTGASGSYEYQFWRMVGGTLTLMQAYSTNDTWVWDTTGATPGTHFIQVRVRNAGYGNAYDVIKSFNYIITAP